MNLYWAECQRKLHGIVDEDEAVEVDGMTFRPVWPPTKREMAKFLFGMLPPREQWPLTYKRGPLAWVPLTALCRLITWDATSHSGRPRAFDEDWTIISGLEDDGGESFDQDWTVIWGVRDDNVFVGEIERAFVDE